MFFRRRTGCSLGNLLLILLGFKVIVKKQRMTEEERAEYKQKIKSFRQKLREAFKVWDQEGTV
ncbi:MAG: hypothetical protein JWN30_1581 [Bacilli bacterium]|nr:hypothetical protein [Bacilli bacterium]